MNKPLLLSLAAASILGTNLDAQSMYERIQSMELSMKKMQKELSILKASEGDTHESEDADEEEVLEENESEDGDGEEVSEENESDEGDDEEVSEENESDEGEEVASGEDSDDEDDDDEDDDDEEITIEEQIEEMEETITELNKATNGNHIKFNVDYRFAIDNLQYTMADGSTAQNNALMTNRLWINMNWKATDNLSFSGQMAYNKTFGQRSYVYPGYSFEQFDWVTNENAFDDKIRLRSAYFLYKNDTFLGSDIPWTLSIGRRPSTNGHLINLRDDDGAASPMGHTINVEFDGLSSKFGLEDVTGVEGMYIKLCAGRGMTNASPKFTPAPYSTNPSNPDIDLGGFIFVPYDNGQYALSTMYYYANNLIDQQFSPTGVPQNSFDTVGDLDSFTANFTVSGIGDEWSDYLDDTFVFASAAVSRSHPNGKGPNPGMFGSRDSKIGNSIWLGLQMPSFTEDGRWGIEYNQGSQYWRPITYAEDTNIGSKIAARGKAYEVYFTESILDDILSLQIRYTYIDYTYSGSNGFFGNTTGTSMLISDIQAGAAAGIPQMVGMASQVVDKAQDLRVYLRYRY